MRRLLMLLVGFLASVFMFAEGVDKAQALRKAQEFMPGKNFQEVKSVSKARGDASGNAFYVFNADNNSGFVIVSGDDRTESILGYAEHGQVSDDNMPDNLRYWLECYAEQISHLDKAKRSSTRGTRTVKDGVVPLISAKWDQGTPYNLMCPDGNGKDYDEGGYNPNNRCLTGCVATAMAQVMYKWKYPTTCQGIDAYTKGFALRELPATTFKWDKMTDTYAPNETGEAADAVAELMRYCGQAAEMRYGVNGSETYVTSEQMINYFGYSKTAKDVYRNAYTVSEWEDMIYEEVAAGRPVLYGGSSASGGHQFICDGYDGNGLFHFNWGWSGTSDGYFVLSLANPYELGSGGGTSKDGYSYSQDAIIGLKPDGGEVESPRIYSVILEEEGWPTEYSRLSASDHFTNVSLPGLIFMQYDYAEGVAPDYALDYGWGLFQDGALKTVLGFSSVTLTNDVNWKQNSSEVEFGSGLADGMYMLRQVYRPTGSNKWMTCEMLTSNYDWGISYIKATISGNNLSLSVSETEYYSSNIAINSVKFSGESLEVGKTVEMTVNLTNNGDAFQELICLWYDNNLALVCGSVEPGKSGEVVLHFVPKTAGNVTYKISTGIETTNDGNNYPINVVWEKSVTVEAAKPQSLTGTIEAYNIIHKVGSDNYYHYYLHGTNLKLKVDVNNTGVNTFDDQVVLKLYKLTPGTNKGNVYASKSVAVKIEPGETKQVDFAINNLNPTDSYFFKIFYNSEGKQTEMSCPGSMVGITFQIVDALLGDANGSGGVDADDIKAVVRFIMEGNFEGFVFDNADVVKDGKVNAADLVKIIDMVGNP